MSRRDKEEKCQKKKNKKKNQRFKVKDEVTFAHWDMLLSESAVLKSNSHQLLKKI